MACLLVPATQALIVTAAKRRASDKPARQSRSGISWSRRLTWLTTMLWGGALLLALEHMWHGERIFSFTTAALHEMATTGIAMAVLVTVVWGVMVAAVELSPRLAAAVKPHTA